MSATEIPAGSGWDWPQAALLSSASHGRSGCSSDILHVSSCTILSACGWEPEPGTFALPGLLSALPCAFSPSQENHGDNQGDQDGFRFEYLWLGPCFVGMAEQDTCLPCLSARCDGQQGFHTSQPLSCPRALMLTALHSTQQAALLPVPALLVRCYCNTHSRAVPVCNKCLACRDMRTPRGLYPTL